MGGGFGGCMIWNVVFKNFSKNASRSIETQSKSAETVLGLGDEILSHFELYL